MSETPSFIPPELKLDKVSRATITWESTEASIQLLLHDFGPIGAATSLLEQLEDTDPSNKKELKRIGARVERIRQEKLKKKTELHQSPGEKEPSEEEKRSLQQLREILSRVMMSGEGLGKGSTAEVFRDPTKETTCYKIIFNKKIYAKHNSVNIEAELQTALADININGTRVPQPYYSARAKDFHVIAMETLKAVTLEDIISNKQAIPKNFNEKIFFSNLEKFVESMHARGIYHRDLHEGNIMVDTETGLPYVIDFGLACRSLNNENPYLDTNAHSKEATTYTNDDDNIRTAKLRVKKYLRSKK